MKVKIVIDTNVSSLSSRSVFHWLVQLILKEEVALYVTDDILLEYEEVLTDKYSDSVAINFITALKELPKVHFVHIYYHWSLVKDADDNKFVDCYMVANAEYLITNDKHFNVLKNISFPVIKIIKIEDFKKISLNFLD